MPINSKVLVWRENQGWTGPHTLISIDGQTCTIQLQNGPRQFRTTVVKPFLEENSIDQHNHNDANDNSFQPSSPKNDENQTTIRRNPPRQRQLPTRYDQNLVVTAFLSLKKN